MTSLQVPSFAKINWLLKILGRREDGYHELRTILQTIDLSDEIVFEVNSDSNIQVESEGRPVARGQDNLLFRAVDLLRRTAGIRSGLRILLRKRIPVGAGLGGGSGNAAVALLAGNQLWEAGLSRPELMRLASQLGSDVPFFLLGGTALGLGRGEELIPIPDVEGLERRSLILLYPRLEVSTKEAYALRDWGKWEERRGLTRETLDNRISGFCEAVRKGAATWAGLENDFQGPVFARYPILAEASLEMKSAGCAQVLLCGSGSTLLGLTQPETVQQVRSTLLRRAIGEVFLCHSLSRKHYGDLLAHAGLRWTGE